MADSGVATEGRPINEEVEKSKDGVDLYVSILIPETGLTVRPKPDANGQEQTPPRSSGLQDKPPTSQKIKDEIRKSQENVVIQALLPRNVRYIRSILGGDGTFDQFLTLSKEKEENPAVKDIHALALAGDLSTILDFEFAKNPNFDPTDEKFTLMLVYKFLNSDGYSPTIVKVAKNIARETTADPTERDVKEKKLAAWMQQEGYILFQAIESKYGFGRFPTPPFEYWGRKISPENYQDIDDLKYGLKPAPTVPHTKW